MQSPHDALKKLLREHGEREKPIAFAGRDALINEILAVAKDMSNGPLKGETFVISGAPGCGKTALLAEISDRSSLPCILCAEVPGDGKTDLIWGQLTEHLTGMPLEQQRSESHESYKSEGGLNIGTKVSVGQTRGKTARPLNIDSCAAITTLAKNGCKTPVIVCIDEVQNIQSNTRAAMLVRELHTQSDAPVLLVCTGLSNSKHRLDEAGISRNTLKHEVGLGGLEKSESEKAIENSLEKIAEIAKVDPDKLIYLLKENIAEACDNWPRHITCYLHGVCEALLERDPPSLVDFDLANALDRGHGFRDQYYQDRLNASKVPARILHNLYQLMSKSNLSEYECADFLYGEVERSDSRSLKERFPRTEVVFQQALRAGVITLNDLGECEVPPIPSLVRYVNEKADSEMATHVP